MLALMPRTVLVYRQALLLACRTEEQKLNIGCKRICKQSTVWSRLLKGISRRLLLLAAIPSPLLVVRAQEMSAQGGCSKKNLQPLLQEADKLLQNYEWSKVYDMLYPYKDVDDVELLWRLTKSGYEITKISKDKKLAKRIDSEGYLWIQRAIKLDNKHPEVHKMMAVMMDAYHSHQGIKARISKSPDVKQHMITAAELNPSDPHPFYMLGWWYYSVADLPWAHVQIVRIIFSTPLEASFEEALKYFEQSLERDKAHVIVTADTTVHSSERWRSSDEHWEVRGLDHSRFYMMNLVMLGKTHLKLGNTEEALKYLMRVSDHQPRTSVDREACVEAASLVAQLGSNTEHKSSNEIAK